MLLIYRIYQTLVLNSACRNIRIGVNSSPMYSYSFHHAPFQYVFIEGILNKRISLESPIFPAFKSRVIA
jgi:hypothetical protein